MTNRTLVRSIAGLATLAIASLGGAAMLAANAGGESATPAAKQETPSPAAAQSSASLDGDALIEGLRSTPGCLGVDAGQMASGKNVIFAWFENKAAALAWYRSDVHKQAMGDFFPDTPRVKPFDGVPDNVPILAIASITMADKPAFEETPLPISQIAIELYTPIKGGIHLGGTFAPAGLKVEGIRDLTKGE